MILKIIKWILVILCMVQIFMFSNDPADESDKKSNFIIVSIAEVLAGRSLSGVERQKKIDEYVVLVRKGAHFFIYFVLGFLVLSLFKEYKDLNTKIILISLLVSILYACSDEIHQLFVVGRSGSIIDVGIDSLGALFGTYFYYFIYLIRRKYEQEKTVC